MTTTKITPGPYLVPSPFLVPFDGSFSVAGASTTPPEGTADRHHLKKKLAQTVEEISDLQERMYAGDRLALLLVFQAIDAAGKDSTIRAVTTGVNPAGCQVLSFKAPSKEELDHDFLWRTARRLPERGRIGVFNRSYYEEVLVVRVHPEFLEAQRVPRTSSPEAASPDASPLGGLWEDRYTSIRDHEAHLARNGIVILKFWLNVSRDEQARRLIRRIDRPEKNWKFNAGDLAERAHWDAYMEAYEEALNATSCASAPWYAIPADDKPYMRLAVAGIVRDRMQALDLAYPTLPPEDMAGLAGHRATLEGELAVDEGP